ncbi:MAG: hypothetical protein KME01_04565 [Chroococcus sp. CMT-3BRIN-NPC107]|nr:hypothetical protein [Chroococcus sp. CMT-3BRIN-NPC107]
MISNTEEQNHTLKPLGTYLVEAGIITIEQLEIALKKQSYSKKRLGTVLVDCGWIKQQTIEYLIEEVVLPRRTTNQFFKSQPHGHNNLTLAEQRNNYPKIASLSISDLTFFLSPRKTTRFLVLLVSDLVLCSLFFQFCVYFLPDYPLRDTLAKLLNIDREHNIPTLYSWSALGFCAMLLTVIARAKNQPAIAMSIIGEY